jgi:hypothetical protein
MKATHTDYLHPRHLRVEGCLGHRFFDGPCKVDVLCVSPSSALHAQLNRSNLKSWSSK